MNLLLHCGAQAVDSELVEAVYTPEPTRTWQPIPHHELLQNVKAALPGFGLRILNEAHALTPDGARYFGLLELKNGHPRTDYGWVLGLRNSHDKRFPAGIVAGTGVFVCDNLSFAGEIQVSRKHTRFILRDLPDLVEKAMRALVRRWRDQEIRVEAYKCRRLTDRGAHDLTIRALDSGVITSRQVPGVLTEWREPSYAAFQPRTAWSWFNAVTENIKGNVMTLPRKSIALHALCDAHVGIN